MKIRGQLKLKLLYVNDHSIVQVFLRNIRIIDIFIDVDPKRIMTIQRLLELQDLDFYYQSRPEGPDLQ